MSNGVVIRTDTHKVIDARAQVRAVIKGLAFIGEWSWDGDNWKTSVTAWDSIDKAIRCAKRCAFIDYIVIKKSQKEQSS